MYGLKGPASISHLHPSSFANIHNNYHFARIYSLQIQGRFKQTYSEPNSLTRTSPLVNVWPTSGLPALVIYTLHHPLMYTTITTSRICSLQIQGGFKQTYSEPNSLTQTSPLVNV
jgi:hypothetical protein